MSFDFETGENQYHRSRRMLAIPMAEFGDSRPAKSGTKSHRAKELEEPLSAEELALAEAHWATLPKFDDLVRGSA